MRAPDYLTLSTKLGAADSLRKPFRSQELLAAVRKCLPDHLKATG